MKKPVSLVFFLAVIAVVFPAACLASSGDYIEEVIKKASERRLYEDRYFEVLLHYKSKWNGTESLVDDPRFFLAPDGKTNPAAELEADIRGFFSLSGGTEGHARCRFPARYEWLKETLGLDQTRLPSIECKDIDEILFKINPKKTVLVFPSAHINNPASMFGHTLVRVDSERESKLVSHAANYSALASDKNGLIYGFKGLFGYYKGFFSVMPYYEKVKEYGDLDRRDMWEYRLDFTEAETRRLVLHALELRDIYSYYYFFDENCSYTLLFLLEAARPELNLTDQFHLSALPLDTVRAVKRAGAVDGLDFRPSLATTLRAIAATLDKAGVNLAADVGDGIVKPEEVLEKNLSADEKIKILELASQYEQIRYSGQTISKDDYQEIFISTLKARGKLGRPNEKFYSVNTPPPPDQGHESSLFALSEGVLDGNAFTEIRFKKAYHNLIDPSQGYQEGAQIEFLNSVIRYYPDGNRLELERLDIVDIASLSPRDRFFKHRSWKVSTGFMQAFLKDDDNHLVYSLDPAYGFAYRNALLGTYYVMGEADFMLGGSFEKGFTLGAGITAGMLRDLTDDWKIHLFGKSLYYGLGDEHCRYLATLLQSYRLDANKTLGAEISHEKTFGKDHNQVKLSLNLFF